jgi:hypothetical protein
MRHLSAVELAEWLSIFPGDDIEVAAETSAQRPLLLDVREP